MEILSVLKESPSMKKSIVAAKFTIPPSTLSTIMKNKDMIQKNFENSRKTMKKSRACSFPDVDKWVRKWFEHYCGEGVPISCLMLQKKKKKLKTFLMNLDLMVLKPVMVGLKALK